MPSDSFRAIAHTGTDPLTRKPRYIRETHKTDDDAQKALTNLPSNVDKEQAPKSNITVEQAIEQCLEVAAFEDTTRAR